LNHSYWDLLYDAVFISDVELVAVGMSIPPPTGDPSGTQETTAIAVAKWVIPR
jgi:hypothetical protein